MELKRITEEEMNAQGVIAAPDILNGTPAQNKAIFDRMVRSLVAPAVNACVDAIEEANGIAESKGYMEAKVYDPQGKKQDVFQYVEDQINGLTATTSYSKDETLAKETKTLFGLGADAVPDDAFVNLHASVESASNTVLDKSTGKPSTISSYLYGVSKKPINTGITSYYCMAYGSNVTDHSRVFSHYKYGNRLVIFSRESANSIHNIYVTVYDVSSDKVLSQTKLENVGSNYQQTYANGYRCYSHDGSVFSPMISAAQYIFDVTNNTYLGISKNSQVFSTPNYWGYMYQSGYNNRKLYIAPRGNTSFTSISLGNGLGSSYYEIELIGSYGDILYYHEIAGQNYVKLCKVNLATKAVTQGIESFDFSRFGSNVSGAQLATSLVDDTHAYLVAVCTVDNIVYGITKPIIVDLATGTTNFSTIAASEKSSDFRDLRYSMNCTYYLGSVGSKAYYAYGINYSNGRIFILDKANGSISACAPAKLTGQDVAYRVNPYEAQFDIGYLPNCILVGWHYFDVSTLSFAPLAYYEGMHYNSNLSGFYERLGYLDHTVLHGGRLITDPKIFATSYIPLEAYTLPIIKRVGVVEEYT